MVGRFSKYRCHGRRLVRVSMRAKVTFGRCRAALATDRKTCPTVVQAAQVLL